MRLHAEVGIELRLHDPTEAYENGIRHACEAQDSQLFDLAVGC